jgi:hypothetical protein
MTRRAGRNDERQERDEPPWASDCTPEPRLAETLIALHRSELAPARVVNRIAAHLDALASVVPARREGRWQSLLVVLRTNLAGVPTGLGLAVVLSLLLTWRQQLADAPPEQADQVRDVPPADEVLLSGTAVPGSLELRRYADPDGMGQCEGQFLLNQGEVGSGEAQRESPIRVRWTRCDLPDALLGELKRRFSPVAGAPRVPVSVWGRWQRADEFEGRRLRLQP